jgi:hypothetical protein
MRRETAFDRYQRAKAAEQERARPAAPAARKVAAQKAPPPPPPPTRGLGWEVLKTPRVPHERLEAHARNIWDFVWHGIDWPAGWRVRWGKLSALEMAIGRGISRVLIKTLNRGQCAVSVGDRVLGLCIPIEKLILIDEAEQRSRTPRQFAETVIHEPVHSQRDPQVMLRDEAHGPRFQAALKNATAYYFGADGEPEPVPAGRKHLPPPAARP